MDYQFYSVEDFVTDEYFIRWVKNPTEESNAFWSAWLSKNPSKEPIVIEARQIVLTLQFEEEKPAEDKFLAVWTGITTSLDRDEVKMSPLQSGDAGRGAVPPRPYKFYKWAAAILLLAVAGAYLFSRQAGEGSVVFITAYGESRTLFLPDSTKVTLNANSTLRYEPGFTSNREVWLEGEAFFAVVHKRDKQNFLVHTNELQVEVLGTRFNVNSRRGKSQVVLEEGKVKLDIRNVEGGSALFMKPGEMVEVTRETKQVEKREVQPGNYSSWRNNRLIFISTPFTEIAEMIEDTYGYKVAFSDEQLKTKQFTGSTSLDDPMELVEKLNKVFGLDIQLEGKEMIIRYSQ